MANPAPVIGNWYRPPGGETFEVVAIDADDRTIEIQYFDGAVEELDLEDWLEEQIAVTEAPEDWTGSVDVEPEDYENEVETQPTEGGLGRSAAIRRSRRDRGLFGAGTAGVPDELDRLPLRRASPSQVRGLGERHVVGEAARSRG